MIDKTSALEFVNSLSLVWFANWKLLRIGVDHNRNQYAICILCSNFVKKVRINKHFSRENS